ncbi:unnamed protein product, partial [Symbiodinium sp. KB8]
MLFHHHNHHRHHHHSSGGSQRGGECASGNRSFQRPEEGQSVPPAKPSSEIFSEAYKSTALAPMTPPAPEGAAEPAPAEEPAPEAE